MRRNPRSHDVYVSSDSFSYEEIMEIKAARQEAKISEERALSDEDIKRINEAGLESLKRIFARYGGHRRYKPN